MKNTKRNFSFLMLAILGLFLASESAHAAVRVGLYGVANSSSIEYTLLNTTLSTSSVMKFGGGTSLEIGNDRVGGELGLIYVPRGYKISAGAGILESETSFNSVQIPILFRVWFNKYVTLAVGGYYAIHMGDATVKTTLLGQETETTVPLEQAGFKSSDYGLTADIGFQIPFSASVALMLEGRYNYGLANVYGGTGTGEIKFREMQGLVGLRIGNLPK